MPFGLFPGRPVYPNSIFVDGAVGCSRKWMSGHIALLAHFSNRQLLGIHGFSLTLRGDLLKVKGDLHLPLDFSLSWMSHLRERPIAEDIGGLFS